MFNYLLNLLLSQILGQPFLLMAIIVFIGYIAMKQKVSRALMGAAKASIGIIAMGMGSSALISNFGYLLTAVQNATGLEGAGLNTYPTMTASYEKMDAILGSGTGATWGIYTLLIACLIVEIVFILGRNRRIHLSGKDDILLFSLAILLAMALFPASQVDNLLENVRNILLLVVIFGTAGIRRGFSSQGMEKLFFTVPWREIRKMTVREYQTSKIQVVCQTAHFSYKLLFHRQQLTSLLELASPLVPEISLEGRLEGAAIPRQG